MNFRMMNFQMNLIVLLSIITFLTINQIDSQIDTEFCGCDASLNAKMLFNGSRSCFNEYFFVAALFYMGDKDGGRYAKIFCTATILSPSYLITSGQCDTYLDLYLNHSQYSLYAAAGEKNDVELLISSPDNYKLIDEVFYHPEHKLRGTGETGVRPEKSLAIVKVKYPFELGYSEKNLFAACLEPKTVDTGKDRYKFLSISYGMTKYGDLPPPQEAQPQKRSIEEHQPGTVSKEIDGVKLNIDYTSKFLAQVSLNHFAQNYCFRFNGYNYCRADCKQRELICGKNTIATACYHLPGGPLIEIDIERKQHFLVGVQYIVKSDEKKEEFECSPKVSLVYTALIEEYSWIRQITNNEVCMAYFDRNEYCQCDQDEEISTYRSLTGNIWDSDDVKALNTNKENKAILKSKLLKQKLDELNSGDLYE